MYNSGYGATSPPLASSVNNPFVADPSSRFPDLGGAASPDQGSQYTAWLANSNPSYPTQQQQNPYQQQQNPQYQQAPQFATNNSYGQQQQQPQQGYASPMQGAPSFQPTSSFGQQLAAQVSGSSYGYLNGQPAGMGQQQQSAYNPAQQQIQNPGYVAQFDPYASLGQIVDGGPQQQQQQPSQFQNPSQAQSQPQTGGSGRSASGELHPREYIRTHKAEIESWDSYAWKQLLNAFEGLKTAWEGRKAELGSKIAGLQVQMQQYGGYYQAQGQIQQEGARLQGLMKEADSNFDSVAASTFQMHEVFSGYRQSGDLASKRRVREATNAALQNLPDWPSQVY